jgi:hypothetical protein
VRREDYVWAVRRRQALDALTFERDREALLVEQLEELHAEVDGERLDASLFAEMDAEDVEIVRAALGYETEPDDVDEDDEEWDVEEGEALSEQEAADDAAVEAERLEAEISSSRRAQAALTRYLELLPQPSADG